jgi:hypothetical protein
MKDDAIFYSILSTAMTIIAVAISRYLSWLQQSGDKKNTDEKLEVIHKLTNSTEAAATATQLRVIAELARWKANSTDDARDAKAASDAEKAYQDHMMRTTEIRQPPRPPNTP